MAQDSVCRGIDHVGVTVPDLDAATDFFARAPDAEVLDDTLRREDGPNGGAGPEQRPGVPPGSRQRAIRMLALPHGPGLELFAFDGPRQRDAALPYDLGRQHLAVYVEGAGARCPGRTRCRARKPDHATAWSARAHRGEARRS
ncbi:VOC family protein [Streptomyces sp. NPDC088915]|uniref:VOC family protein n=1 Tax=Streptomyces sp. NPDC088915 TaxID=3365912 RepID=UPI0037F1BAE7